MQKVGDHQRTDFPEDLREACSEFLEAGRKYREFLKRNYRDRLFGVISITSEDEEMVLYSENKKYSKAINSVVLES